MVHAAVPEYPYAARVRDLGPASVLVELAIPPDGTPTSVTIYKSSGDRDIDRAAIDAARKSTYTAKVVDCTRVTAQYLFRAVFLPSDPLRYVTPPRFSPPNGWSKSNNASPAPGFREFGEWTQEQSVVGVMGALTPSSLAQYVAHRLTLLKNSGAQIFDSDSVPLCNDKNGWKVTYAQGATQYAELMQVIGERVYDAYYYSTSGPPDQSVTAAMLSLCVS